MEFKLGKRPATYDRRDFKLARYLAVDLVGEAAFLDDRAALPAKEGRTA